MDQWWDEPQPGTKKGDGLFLAAVFIGVIGLVLLAIGLFASLGILAFNEFIDSGRGNPGMGWLIIFFLPFLLIIAAADAFLPIAGGVLVAVAVVLLIVWAAPC